MPPSSSPSSSVRLRICAAKLRVMPPRLSTNGRNCSTCPRSTSAMRLALPLSSRRRPRLRRLRRIWQFADRSRLRVLRLSIPGCPWIPRRCRSFTRWRGRRWRGEETLLSFRLNEHRSSDSPWLVPPIARASQPLSELLDLRSSRRPQRPHLILHPQRFGPGLIRPGVLFAVRKVSATRHRRAALACEKDAEPALTRTKPRRWSRTRTQPKRPGGSIRVHANSSPRRRRRMSPLWRRGSGGAGKAR